MENKFANLISQISGIPKFPPIPWMFASLSKSEVAAEGFRLIGNNCFKQGQFYWALHFYNCCLCYAPAGSTNIALAYGNRSAAFLEMSKYALSLENIKLARENGYPAEKMTQLNDGEVKCKELIEKFGPSRDFDVHSFFKLSHPPNKKIPFIVDCLKLRQNEKYGRYVVTTKDLKTGDIIAIEKAVTALRYNTTAAIACNFCTNSNQGSLIPCPQCTSVMYCTTECLKKNAYHHNEANANEAHKMLGLVTLKMQFEAFRIAGGVNELLELMKDSENKTIFDFDLSNPDDPSYEKNMLKALNGLCKNMSMEEMREVKPEELLNIPPINEKPRTLGERKQLLKFIISQFLIMKSNITCYDTKQHIGLFLFRSLLNHSCYPNADFVDVGNEKAAIVISPIKAGEQIFICYEALALNCPFEKRQEKLQRFPFKCDCIACVDKLSPPFPRKDRRFIEPLFVQLKPHQAIAQLKKNCKYIDKNIGKNPSYEIAKLITHNRFLQEVIAGEVRENRLESLQNLVLARF